MAGKKGGASNSRRIAVQAGARVATALARGAFRRWRRYTANKKAQRRRQLNKNIMPVGTGASQSFHRVSYKPKLSSKVLKELTPIRCYVETSAETMRTLAYGVQKATGVAQFPCSTIGNYFTNLVDSSGSNTQRIFLRSIEQEYMISNASSANVFLKIYECTARQDITANSGSPVLNIVQWNPAGAFDQGVYDVNTGMSAMTLGTTPFQSQFFTNIWKVDKIYNIELGAGRSHKHLSKYSPNRLIDESRSSRNSILKGVTRSIMILAFGSPINDTTDNTKVSTSLIALNIVRKQVAKVQSINPQGLVYFNQQSLGTVAQAEHIDEEGNIQNEFET